MSKINIINGVLLASRNELTGHSGNATEHITQEERERWNAGPGRGGPSGELAKDKVQAVVDKRLYDAGIVIKRVSPETVEIPAEGGRVEFAIDTNIPLSGRRLVREGSDPAGACIPPHAVLVEEKPDRLVFYVESNPSIKRIGLNFELYACELEVKCDHEWHLLTGAMPGFTVTPASGLPGTNKVHLASSGTGEDSLLRLIVTDGRDAICAFIATIAGV